MTLQQLILRALEYYDCRVSHLAKATGISQAIIYRVKTGEQKGVHSDNLLKLQPFLSLKMPKDVMDGIRKPKKKDCAPAGGGNAAFYLP